MLSRDESFTVISMVVAVLGLALSVATAVFAFGGYTQSSVNTQGINAQIRAQRELLRSNMQLGLGSTGTPDAVQRALRALQEYKLPEDQ